jgi:endonuclease YncB( thermonuclease family)
MSKTAPKPAPAQPAPKPAAATPPAAKPDATKPAAGKPAAAKPGDKPDAALPDAALLDREGDAGASAAVPHGGRFSRFLPKGPWRWVAIGAACVVIVGSATAAVLAFSRPPTPKSPIIAGPAQAVSGARLVIAGETIQLDGIEAPPASLVCRDGAWEYKCGEESRRALEKELRGRQVECLRTAPANGAMTAAQCQADGIDLAATLVEGGWAVIDLKRSSRYIPQQMRAQSENRGLWRNDFAMAEQWRLNNATR